MEQTNYSYETSLPAYRETPSEKAFQSSKVLESIKDGKSTLLEISEALGLAQSTVSGRVNDLIEEGTVKYDGFTNYKNRKRKNIIVTNA